MPDVAPVTRAVIRSFLGFERYADMGCTFRVTLQPVELIDLMYTKGVRKENVLVLVIE